MYLHLPIKVTSLVPRKDCKCLLYDYEERGVIVKDHLGSMFESMVHETGEGKSGGLEVALGVS